MKIAVIIDTWFPFMGGGQVNAWEISRRLAQNGNEVEVITRNNGKDDHKNLNKLKITKLGKFSEAGDDLARLKYMWRAFFYLTQNNFDLVIAHAFLPGLVAKMFMIFKRKPAILVVHGTSIGTNLNKGAKALLEKFILTRIKYSAEISVSRDFMKIKNVNKNIVYISNGANPIFFKLNTQAKRKKNALLFVGRLHAQKNLINLIKAIRLLVLESFPVTLTIVGNGPQKQEILNLIKKFKLDSTIKLEGAKYGLELVKYFHRSSALILPSIYEGQPLTLLDAWAAKLPVIASRTGDNTFLIKDGQNGYFIKDQKNPKDIVSAIKRALKNNNLDRLGQNGHSYIQNNISWDKSATKTQELLKTFAQ